MDLQRTVSQDFSKNVQQANTEINQHLDKLKADKEAAEKAAVEALANGDIETAERKIKEAQSTAEKADNWQRGKVILNMIASGLAAPTQSGAGIAAATASPAVSYAIGQEFKKIAEENKRKGITEEAKLTKGQETAHILAHAVLGAAVSASGGNDALAGALSAGGAEAAAPVISGWLYGEKDGSKLTAEQKETVVAITGLLGTTVGAVTGNTDADAVSGNLNANSAVGHNYLTPYQLLRKEQKIQGCLFSKDPKCEQKIVQEFDAISLKQDSALAADCQQDPDSLSCKQQIGDALEYIGNRRDSYTKQSDINQSRKRVLDVANNTGYSAINDLTRRANYFGAMYVYTKQPWFRAAEEVSRVKLNIANSFGFSDWVAEAGGVIMKNGYKDFADVYKNYSRYSYNWSEKRLYREQTDPELQRVHKKYYQQWKSWWGKFWADRNADGDLLNYKNRMKVGCSTMPEVEACKKWK